MRRAAGAGQGGAGPRRQDADLCGAGVGLRHLPGIFNGAGSTLSAAATALLALDNGQDQQGQDGDQSDVQQAVVAAQEFTAGALTHARRFGMGKLVPNRLFKAGI